jgi:hypothetical protein
MHGGSLPAHLQPRPVVDEQPGGQSPVPRRPGVPDRLHGVSMVFVPFGSYLVQRCHLCLGGGMPQLQLQLQLQLLGEQAVIAEPG